MSERRERPRLSVIGPSSPAPAPSSTRPEAAASAAFFALDRISIAWSLLRGAERLNALGGDVDLLVDPIDVSRAGRLLASLGFAPIRAWGRGTHRFFVAYDLPGDRWLKLDIVSELAFGRYLEMRFDATEECLRRRRFRRLVFALSPDDEFWALVLHCALDRGEFRPGDGQRLLELLRTVRTDGPIASRLSELLPPAVGPQRAVELVRSEAWDELLRLVRHWRSIWLRRRWYDTLPRMAVNVVLRRLMKLHVALSRRGITVVLLGPDGVGKSTLAAGLENAFILRTQTLYGGLYGRHESRVPGLALAMRVLRLRLAAARAAWHRVRGRLVILDRSAHDALLPRPEPLSRRARLRRRLLASAAPRPDLVLLLDAPGATAFARKQEHTAAFLEQRRAGYLALAAALPNCVVLDATRNPDEVRRAAISSIWRRFAEVRAGQPRRRRAA